MPRLRVVFMGTPDFSVPTLQNIITAGHEVVAAYSQPPSRSGRGKKERLSPVHQYAHDQNIPVHTPISLKNEEQQDIFRSHEADVAVVVAYGLLLPKPVLDAPEQGCLNLHGSLLPRWRGAAPIQRALMAGDSESGVMVMRMEEGLDTGPYCMTYRCLLTAGMTAGQLHDDLMTNGADLMVHALEALSKGKLSCEQQPEEGTTYARKIKKTESRIDWKQPAQDVHNRIRGLSPFPGAWFEVVSEGKTERIKILESSLAEDRLSGTPGEIIPGKGESWPMAIACKDGAIHPLKLQRAGKKPVPIPDFLRGFSLPKSIL